MQYIRNNTNITRTGFIADGVSYPSGWCETASPELLVSLGITVTDDPVDPEPVVEVPEFITMRQCRRELIARGKLEEVKGFVYSMGELAISDWESCPPVYRNDQLVAGMIYMLGWSGQDADDFFIAAAKW